MTTTAATTEFLWINQGGMVTCEEHGGQYLKAAIAAKPAAKTHTTPLDHWQKIPTGIIEDGWELRCETCSRAGKETR